MLIDLAGAGEARSDGFRPSGPWVLSWSYDCTLVTNADPGFALSVAGPEEKPVIDRSDPLGSGIEELAENGLLYLKMTTECPWKVNVVD